jgi:hypothetical protein
MNHIKGVLEQALDQLPPSAVPADPEPDLIRGRNLLRRRRVGAVVVCAAVAIVLVPVLAQGHDDNAGSHPAAVSRAAYGDATHHDARGPVRLVAYPGPQPSGYTVKEIPAGWVIQGSNSYVLTIAPASDPDKNADSFLGKLVVTWSADYTASPSDGTPVTVAGQPGYYDEQNADGVPTQSLAWKDPRGRWLVVQTPASLGWNETELAAFAAGVTVLPGAQPSVG